MSQTVLVTGGTGFLGSHCIAKALSAGYHVRTTVRSRRREADVRAMVAAAGIESGDRLSFVEADLSADAGWSEATAGCSYALHVASPFPPGMPRHEDELIVPARDGALRLLRAARDALRGMLTANAPPPDGEWADLAVLAPVRDYRARHAATLLAFDAAVTAVERAESVRGKIGGI